MKHRIIVHAMIVFVMISCGKKQSLIEESLIDSSIANYSRDYNKVAKFLENDLNFWKNRTIGQPADIVNSVKFAALLISKFQITGDVNYIHQSDSILFEVSKNYNHKESSIFSSLSNHYILQHRFHEADSLFKKADSLGLKTYNKLSQAFDIYFELGLFQLAEKSLLKLNQTNDFGYQFRISKLMHYKGDLDSSIKAMQLATQLVSNNETLLQNAQSNLADLYLHDNDVKNAYFNYKVCLQKNASDLHSLMGLGWLALVHDGNDSLAKHIFEFAATKTLLPDPIFKLVSWAQFNNDTINELHFAQLFEQKAAQNIYGNMYNKYLILLYTQILNNPLKAVDLARKEIINRATPQTYSWLVYSLAFNKEFDEADKLYKEFVEGKPLEGLELYYMGKYMLAKNKIYNAKQYFKEAAKNKYDLSPRIMDDINKQLN